MQFQNLKLQMIQNEFTVCKLCLRRGFWGDVLEQKRVSDRVERQKV